MTVLNLNKTIYEILSMSNINNFSAIEIRTACIANLKNESLQPSDVRQCVYNVLLKLTKKGWLLKSITKKKGLTHYSKTNLFDSDHLKKSFLTIGEETVPANKTSNSPQALKNRLNLYSTELLEGLGAVKEYIELKSICPHLHTQLKKRFLSTQENNHILKGKIAVLNELISINTGIEQ